MSTVLKEQVGAICRCFIELFTYAALFEKTCAQKQRGHAEVHAQISQLLAASAKLSTDSGIDPRDYDDARFAVCAWLDEMLMNLPWTHRNEWQRSLLQTELYATTNAGEEFFERLNRLGKNQNHIREIYFMCLCLGFMGRYCHPGDEILLGQLKLSNINELLGSRASMDYYSRDVMFNCAYESLGSERSRFLPIPRLSSIFSNKLFVILIPIVILVGLFIVYTFVLDGVKENLINYLVGT